MNSTNQLVLRIMIAVVAIMGAIVAIMLLIGDSYQSTTSSKIVFITFSMLIYGITASFCYAITRKRQYNGLAIFGMTVSAIAFFLNLFFILSESSNVDLAKAMAAFFFLAIGLAHICFLFYISIQNKYAEIVRIIAIIFISLFTLLIVVKIFDSWDNWYMAMGLQKYLRYVLGVLTLDLTASLLVVLCNQIRTHDPNDSLVLSDPPTNNPPGVAEVKDSY